MISIIITAYNKLAYTQKCINSIIKTAHDFEIIVINNASTDGTKEWLDDLALKNKNIIPIHNKVNKGQTGRNDGLVIARGDILFQIDNDVEVYGDWQDICTKELQHKTIGAVGHQGLFVKLDRQPTRSRPHGEVIFFGYTTGGSRYVDLLVGYFWAFRREIYDKLGGYDEAFGRFGCEESDFHLKIKSHGFRIKTVPIKIKHYGHITESQFNRSDSERLVKKNMGLLLNKWGGKVDQLNLETMKNELSK